jgi:hypothetical protein
MPPRPKSKVIASLKAKGFEEVMGDHIILIYHTKDGKKTTARTHTSHSPKMKVIDDSLLTQMAKQCKLTKSEFMELVDCPMSREQYELTLAKLGLV